jgi:hypothetical protein
MKLFLVSCNLEEGEGVDIQEAIEMCKRGQEEKCRLLRMFRRKRRSLFLV